MSSADFDSERPDVLLLAAGFGTRLKPLTDACPKPLLPIGGKPIIEWNLELLAENGFERVFINLHYLGDMIRDHVGDGSKWGISVEYSEEPILLDTGGALKAIEHRISSDDLLAFNSDILVERSFPFEGLIEFHRGHHARPLATLVLRHDPEADRFGSFIVSKDGRILRMLDTCAPGFERICGSAATPPQARSTGGSANSPVGDLMFTGIQVISKPMFTRMPAPGTVFSSTRDLLRKAVGSGAFVGSYRYDGYWNDIGTPERLVSASKDIEAFEAVGAADD